MRIARIVSGGQTGADQGGWDAAIYCDLPYGGWVPKGRKTEAGPIPAKYSGYTESHSPDYLARTEANVVDSDATLIFCYGLPTGGSKKTVDFAVKHSRPFLTVDLRRPRAETVRLLVLWIEQVSLYDVVLNVAGSRESKAPGIRDAVCARMVDVIAAVNRATFYPLPDIAKSSASRGPT
jgi:hypothetical protein